MRVLLGTRLAGPHAATTVRFAGGSSLIEDGPFTKEVESAAGSGSSRRPISTKL
jgi:hypothetical protein